MKKLMILLNLTLLIVWACKNETKSDTSRFDKTGNPQIDALTEQIFKDPKNAQLYFKRAQLFYKEGAQGGHDVAIKDMVYALSLDSTNLDFHHFLSDVYMDYAQSRLAVSTMERAVVLAPEHIPTLLKMGETYLITKQYNSAGASIDKVLKKDPQNADAYFLLGMIFKEQNDTARAINSFQKSADLDSDNKDAFIELGKLFTEKGNPLALKYFNNALLIDSLDVNAMMAKAYYFQTKNQITEAIVEYKKILYNDPRYEFALFNLGLLYLEKDSLEQADSHFNIVIKEAPTFFKAYYYRGYIAEKRGDKNSALKNYKQALEFNSGYDKALDGVKRLSSQ